MDDKYNPDDTIEPFSKDLVEGIEDEVNRQFIDNDVNYHIDDNACDMLEELG